MSWRPLGKRPSRSKDKALNERMYEIFALNKAETAKKYGDVQVKIWRRSDDVKPWRRKPKDTAERALPYYEKMIKPCLLKGKPSSLRRMATAFVRGDGLDQLSKEEVLNSTFRPACRSSTNWTTAARYCHTAICERVVYPTSSSNLPYSEAGAWSISNTSSFARSSGEMMP